MDESEILVDSCEHSDGLYTLQLDMANVNASLDCTGFACIGNPGMNTHIDLRNISPEMMLKLAEAVKNEALKRIHEQEDRLSLQAFKVETGVN